MFLYIENFPLACMKGIIHGGGYCIRVLVMAGHSMILMFWKELAKSARNKGKVPVQTFEPKSKAQTGPYNIVHKHPISQITAKPFTILNSSCCRDADM